MKIILLSFVMLFSPFLGDETQVKKLLWEVQRHFMLVQMPGFTRDQLVDARAEIDLTLLPNSGIYIYGDTTYVPVKIKTAKQIRFLVSNKEVKTHDCKGDAIKAALIKLLPTINRYKIDGHFILLYSDKKLLIKAIAEDWD